MTAPWRAAWAPQASPWAAALWGPAGGWGSAFDPASIPSALWLDDFGTFSRLFQDSAGTTPVTAYEQYAGLVLDQSQGEVLGPELRASITTGIVGTATAATYNTSTGAGTLTRVDGSNQSFLQLTGLDASANYLVDIENTGSTQLAIRQGTSLGTAAWVINAGVRRTEIFSGSATCVPTTSIGTGTITVHSIKLWSGNHATQPTSTSRPQVSARYNRLLATEDFSDAFWSEDRGSVSTDGTGQLFTEDVTTGRHRLYMTSVIVVTAGLTYKARIELKRPATPKRYINLGLTDNITGAIYVYVDTQTWTISQAIVSGGEWTNGVAALETTGDGWYEVAITGKLGPSRQMLELSICLSNSATGGVLPSYEGDGVSGMYWRHPDIRLNPDSQLTVPAYQRVTTANDYDTVGFPPYLLFDGLDDRLLTTMPATTGTMVVASEWGTVAYPVSIPAASFAVGTNGVANVYSPYNQLEGLFISDAALSPAQIAQMYAYYGQTYSGATAYTGCTTLESRWRGNTWISGTFPALNVSSVTTAAYAFAGATGVQFGAGWFDAAPCTNYTDAFLNMALTQTSVDNILVSIAAAGTSNGTVNITGGTSATPGAAGLAAKATLEGRGWTVTHN